MFKCVKCGGPLPKTETLIHLDGTVCGLGLGNLLYGEGDSSHIHRGCEESKVIEVTTIFWVTDTNCGDRESFNDKESAEVWIQSQIEDMGSDEEDFEVHEGVERSVEVTKRVEVRIV